MCAYTYIFHFLFIFALFKKVKKMYLHMHWQFPQIIYHVINFSSTLTFDIYMFI